MGKGLNAFSLVPGFIFGIVGGSGLLILDLLFVPYFPEQLLKTALKTTQWENFTASFYGGINEELFTRLECLLSHGFSPEFGICLLGCQQIVSFGAQT